MVATFLLQNENPSNQVNDTLDTENNSKWGSFHCEKYKKGGKCDLCSHMKEKEYVESFHFDIPSKIHGHLAHDKMPEGMLRWFIYSIEDIPCHLKTVGSTTDPPSRWRTHKSTCNSQNSNSTGLSKHFKTGCPNDTGRSKNTLDFTLLDYHDTTQAILNLANHEPGPKCRCSECGKLKSKEDEWILKLGTFYENGLNSRDEIKARSRSNWH